MLVGESGAGKTSILASRRVSISRSAEGSTLDGEVYADTDAGIAVPAWRRDIGYVAQDYALFPHLSVQQNVAFGLEAAGVPRDQITSRVGAALRRTGIRNWDRGPGVALRGTAAAGRPGARPGARSPAPAAGRAAGSARPADPPDDPGELRDLLRALGCVTLYVTHSPIEALLFGDRIVVVERGRVSQIGTRDELLRYPRSRYVAELMGTNLFAGVAGAGGEGTVVRTGEGDLAVSDAGNPGDVFVAVDPKQITIHVRAPEGSAQNVLTGPILELAPEPPSGDRLRVVLGTRPPLVAEVTREAVAELGLREGLVVYASFKATGTRTYR